MQREWHRRIREDTRVNDLCRVTIMAPRRRIDLSIPADIPLAQLLPTLLQASGQDLADSGLTHSGWALQRLDEAPFSSAQSLATLGVRDGEVLYLRPQLSQLPELAFDDVADVIATGVNDRPDRWRPETTRRFGLAAAAAVLSAGLAVPSLAGPPWTLMAIVTGVMAVLLVGVGALLSRAAGDAAAGAVLGYCALPYAFLGGLLAPARPVPLPSLGALHLLAAFAAVSLVAVAAGFAIAEGLPNFLGIGGVALFGVAGAGCVAGFGLSPVGVAAFTAATGVVLTAMIPSLAFKLARLPLPPVPADADELRSAARPFDGPTVLRRTGEADRFATGLVTGVGLMALAGQAFLITADGWLPHTMSVVLSAVLLLRARVFHGRAQRLWMLVVGLAGLAVAALEGAAGGSPGAAALTVLLPLLVAAGVILGMALRLPAGRPTPFWGRAGDLLDLALVTSLIPLALGLLGLYSWLRGLSG
ncbi:type VII secretion integral membrane protein EccD [Actinomadura craniellae]|uniref:Type VII secretion integral membrane protein EccD n=1 Tax=Actinomadura craniellae TaxID=2231787 RepID=A0A365GXB1_9ACTN|nr:type VII secretion integral membrane protein EccD [Actinomadura craniellae]RAY11456.1 type VII secretion integral membrane protein EccD [Actinomadura craniellae]